MKLHPETNFTVDKQTASITVERGFAADKTRVWDAWTKPELLDKWWAPKPYRNKTKVMNFTPGGYWLYAMISPQDEIHWCRADYTAIHHLHSYSATDAFCDEAGLINTQFPRAVWHISFFEKGETTVVKVFIRYESLEDLEKIVSMGFQEGFSMALRNLDAYIQEQFRLRK